MRSRSVVDHDRPVRIVENDVARGGHGRSREEHAVLDRQTAGRSAEGGIAADFQRARLERRAAEIRVAAGQGDLVPRAGDR